MASILGAAVAPFITTWLVTSHGVTWVGGYLSVVAACSFVALLAMHETRDAELVDV
nr:general substrate transporter [Mycolicibacter nonchromogenicus]